MNVIIRTFISLCLPVGVALAQTTTIDFADSTGSPTSFTSRGFNFDTSTATVLGITPYYQIWALSGAYAFTMTEANDELFSLSQMRVQFYGNQPIFAAGGIVFKGNLQGGGAIFHSTATLTYADVADGVDIRGDETVVFDSSWTNLTSVDVYLTAHTNSLTGFFIDDMVVGPGAALPAMIDVDTAIRPVHPDHDGSASSPGGINDVIEVVVMGSSTGAGDPVDLDTGNIDPATLRFGPSAATVDAGSSSQFNVNYDNDGIDDARFYFLTGDTGIGCADTEVTLTGELIGGIEFSGTDSAFDSECDADCH